MKSLVLLSCFLWAADVDARGTLVYELGHPNCSRYAFFRDLSAAARRGHPQIENATRRVFGGSSVPLATYPAACALLDRYMAPLCSAAVLRAHWALTAAHCVTPHVAYVSYNARSTARDTSDERAGQLARITYRYRHPQYGVLQEDEGKGSDIVRLQNDVGLVRTDTPMVLRAGALGAAGTPQDPLVAFDMYQPEELIDQVVEVYGFGRTERSALGEELFQVKLRMKSCGRPAWYHCLCGVAARGGGAGGGGGAGVCTGDSGGPVVFRGVQVALTSLGPLECAEGAAPRAGATSVFTALYPYRRLVRDTINEVDTAARMRVISANGCPPRAPPRHPAPHITLILYFIRRLCIAVS